MKQNIDYCIIGGGVSGCYLANKLKEQDKDLKIELYESRDDLGGKITPYKEENIEINPGGNYFKPNHIRVLQLVKKYKLKIEKMPEFLVENCITNKWEKYSLIFKYFHSIFFPNIYKISNIENKTVFEILSLLCSPKQIQLFFIFYPYWNEILFSNAKIFFQNWEKDVPFINFNSHRILPSYGKLISCLKNDLEKNKIPIFLLYNLKNIKWNTSKKIWTIFFTNSQKLYSKNICLTIPPNSLLHIPYFYRKYLYNFQLKTVLNSETLLRIYAFCNYKNKDCIQWLKKLKHRNTQSSLQQIEIVNIHKGVFQISYTSDMWSDVWNNLFQNSENIEYVQHILTTQLKKIWNDFHESWIKKIIPFYWKYAVHYWLKRCDPEKEMIKWIHPEKNRSLFLANEAFSTYHGWVEGSLQSVETCLEQINKLKKNN